MSGGPQRERAAERGAPLSYAQQRLWFLDRMSPGPSADLIVAAARLDGPLDPRLLAACLAEVRRRHQVLRTVFPSRGGRPVQRVEPAAPLDLEPVDLGHLPAAAAEAEVRRAAAAEARRPVDLERGPLLTARLFRLAPRRAIFVLAVHHIVWDGWSFGVFVRELGRLYAARAAGRRSPLAEPALQYADFCRRQRARGDAGAWEDDLAYWRQRLAGAPPVLELPLDRPRPAVASLAAGSVSTRLGADLTARLGSLARTLRSTPYQLLLAAFLALLQRHGSQRDLVVGCPVAGRDRPELRDLIGLYANTVTLRTDLSGDPPFGELVARARRTVLGAYAHQQLPFERLVEELRPGRTLSHAPLYQAMVGLQVGGAAGRWGELSWTPWRIERAAATPLDLTLLGWDDPGGLYLSLEHRRDLFEGATAERMLRRLENLLAAVAADPGCRLSRLPLLGPAERRMLVVEWSRAPDAARRDAGDDDDTGHQRGGRATAELEEGPIQPLLAERAAAAPDAPAVVAEGVRLTYRQLHARAGRLAAALAARGAGPESRVGVAAGRSAELVVALLGVLRAGAAFVPLDPDDPPARLAATAADARLSLLVTRQALVPRLPAAGPPPVLLDRLPGAAAGGASAPPPAPLPVSVSPHNLAYVIYTSGSTGRPKGVMIEHQGLADLLRAQRAAIGVRPGERVLQLAAPGFDACIWEVLLALAWGATLHIPGSDGRIPGPGLLGYLREHRIQLATLPPSVLAALPAEPLPDLHTLMVAGEPCPRELVRRWAPGRRFLNLYGPTEATIWTTWSELGAEAEGPEAEGPEAEGPVAIGHPIPGTRTYVLDRRLELQPPGVAGELCIAGRGVARGYLDRPRLTAERFVPDPFGDGARIHLSGDRARHRPDGRLELHGRLDRQLKLRGFRVEPGEVEAALVSHPAVGAAAAVVRGEGGPLDRLLAFVSSDAAAGGAPPERELRRHLAARLPRYMLPDRIVPVDALPLTASGKLDRRALAALPLAAAEPAAAPRAGAPPPGTLEGRLLALWRRLLERPDAGVHDSFFDLGGHSFLLVRLQEELRRALGREVPVTDFFRHPTVHSLAAHLAGDERPAPADGAERGRERRRLARRRRGR